MKARSSKGFDDLLDELAATLFGGEEGERRLSALVQRYDEIVGPVHAEDPYWELFQAHRADWALCEAEIPGGLGPGDTWLSRVLAGQVPEVPAPVSYLPLRSTYCGLFEVWPASKPFLRDRLRGLCLPVADTLEVEPARRGQPAALWELRIAFEHGHARLCRPPLPYPRELFDLVELAEQRRWRELKTPLDPLWLRRGLLRYVRATRVDPRIVFEPAIAAALSAAEPLRC